MPTKDQPQGKKVTLDDLDHALKGGQRETLTGKFIDTKNASVQLLAGIPEHVQGTLYIYVSGLARRESSTPYLYPSNGAATSYKLYERGIIKDAPCVSFAGPTQWRRTVNFGQELDQQCLDMVYKEVVRKNPLAKIVIIGVCIGATTVLNYLANPEIGGAEKFSHLDSVILQSPYISFDEVTKHMSNKYMPTGLKWLLPSVFQRWFINAKTDQTKEQVLGTYNKIPKHVKVFTCYLKGCWVCDVENIDATKARLTSQLAQTPEFFESTGPGVQHGRLFSHEPTQQAIRGFLQKHKLDHKV